MSDETSPDFSAAYRALVEHCEQNELKFDAAPERKAVNLFLAGQFAIYSCTLDISPDDDVVRVRMVFPVVAKHESARALVSETLTRANHGMALGAFDFDLDEGDISYHIGQIIVGVLDDSTIGGLVATALAASDRYFPALMQVLFAGHTPGDAVYIAELDLHSARAEDPAPAQPEPPRVPPKAPRAKKSRRRARKDLGATRELPGLLDGKADAPSAEGADPPKDAPPPAA